MVELIVDHVVGSSRLVYAGVRANSEEYKALLKPLLTVCQLFRAAAIPSYYSHYCLELNRFVDISDRGYKSERTHSFLDYPSRGLVKDLAIELRAKDVLSGKILRALSLANCGGTLFPLARKLLFSISIRDEAGGYIAGDLEDVVFSLGDEGDANRFNFSSREDSVVAFARWIRHMAPKASEVSVSPSDRSLKDFNAGYDGLVSQLFQLVSRVDYACVMEYGRYPRLQFDTIGSLTHVSAVVHDSYEQFMQLARYNSRTLQSFSIESHDCIDIADFILNADGSCAEYPQLLLLVLKTKAEFSKEQRFVFTDVVPFPSLKRFSVNFDLPFGDDTPFRGNESTLEVLSLELRNATVSMLRQHRVFTPGSHPNLRHVSVSSNREDESDVLFSATDFMKFTLSVGPGASVRTIHNHLPNSIFAPEIPLLFGYSCIQVLSLWSTELTLWETLELIKSLPLLSDLHAKFLFIDVLPQVVSLDELPDYVRTTYASVGKRFRCFHITSNLDHDTG
ncbi:hypothetical protein GGI21_002925, partial [Coemansia aciculifera]